MNIKNMNNLDAFQIPICKNCTHNKFEHRNEPNGPKFYDHRCLICKCRQFM